MLVALVSDDRVSVNSGTFATRQCKAFPHNYMLSWLQIQSHRWNLISTPTLIYLLLPILLSIVFLGWLNMLIQKIPVCKVAWLRLLKFNFTRPTGAMSFMLIFCWLSIWHIFALFCHTLILLLLHLHLNCSTVASVLMANGKQWVVSMCQSKVISRYCFHLVAFFHIMANISSLLCNICGKK